MTWFNFRSTSGYVTDGPNEVYVLQDAYPTVRDGKTFGYDDSSGVSTRDRSNGIGSILAGEHFISNGAGSQRTFIVDTGNGSFDVRLAIGPYGATAISHVDLVALDNTNTVQSVLAAVVSGEISTAGQIIDAAGTEHANQAAWESSNASIPVTLSGSSVRLGVRLGANAGGVSYNTHIRTIEIAPPQTDPQLDTPNSDVSVQVGQSGTIDFGSNFSDVNADALTFSIAPDLSLQQGWSWDSATGIASYDGTQQVLAAANYTISADDGQGGTPATDVVQIEVTPPALQVNSVSTATPAVNGQVTVNFSNALGVVTAGDFNVSSQSAGQAVIDIPNPTTFILSGQTDPTLPFGADITIPISDGTNTDNAVVQIQPEAGYTYTEITAIHADGYYAQVPGLAVGMWAYWRVTSGDVVFDPTDGRGAAGPAGGTIEIRFYNGEWGSAATITYPAYSADLVSIDSVTPSRNGAVIEFSYPSVDVTAFEYTVDNTNWFSATSPLTLTGLTEETEYTLQIRPVLDGNPGVASSTVLTTLPAVDATPNTFSFTAQTSLARSVNATSNSITVLGVDAGVDIPITVANGEISVSTDSGATWGAWSSANQTVRLNYRVRARHTTSSSYNSQVTTTVTIGGVAGQFSTTTLADTVPPVITLTGGNVTIEQGSAWVEPGYSAIDNADGDISVSGVVVTGSVDVNTLGPYTLTYTATDAAGNVATTTRIVTVVEEIQSDTLSPVISLVGGNVTISEGGIWSEPGYSAVDDTDGDITNSVVVTGSVNTSVPGTYTLTYTASDQAGNVGSVERTVTVVAAIVYPILVNAPATRTLVAKRASRVEQGEAIFVKQPEEILDYDFDLTEFLASEGDTLPDGNYNISSNSDDLKVVGSGVIPSTNRVKVWLSGGKHGTSGTAYPVELAILTAGFRTFRFLMRVVVIDMVQ